MSYGSGITSVAGESIQFSDNRRRTSTFGVETSKMTPSESFRRHLRRTIIPMNCETFASKRCHSMANLQIQTAPYRMLSGTYTHLTFHRSSFILVMALRSHTPSTQTQPL